MADRKTVISHLQIIHTWAEFARERDLQFFTAKHLEDIAQWTKDTLELLKGQEQAMKEKDGTISNLIAQIKEISQCYERIVRCKDCKNWIPGYITDQDDFIPPKCGKYQQMVGHSNDDFCSFAEKKEGR